jgi:hypothetical protein
MVTAGKLTEIRFPGPGKQRSFTFDVIAKPIHPLQLLQQLKEL